MTAALPDKSRIEYTDHQCADNNSPVDCDVLIIGGGHAGLLAASWLSDSGFHVRLVDPDLNRGTLSGRSLALVAGSIATLRRANVWPGVASCGVPIERVCVRDSMTGAEVVYRAEEVGTGPLAYGFKQNALHAALRQHVLHRWPKIQGGCWFGGLRRQGGHMLAEIDGGFLRCGLVIAADGRGSRVRKAAGIALTAHRFGQHALSFSVHHARPHQNSVIERLLPAGPLATLPVGDSECGITWVRDESERVPDSAHLLAELDRCLDGKLGRMTLASTIERYPLGAQHAKRYAVPGIALIGDAAHGAHPIHAQGFNMGVADIEALGTVLCQARERGEPIGGACLRRYESLRRRDNSERLMMTGSLNRLFSNANPMTGPIRQAILGSLGSVPPLRHGAIRHGMRLDNR